MREIGEKVEGLNKGRGVTWLVGAKAITQFSQVDSPLPIKIPVARHNDATVGSEE